MEKTSETKLHEQKESNDPFNDDVEQAFIRIVEAANGLAPLLSSSQMQDRVNAANDLITRKILFLIRRELSGIILQSECKRREVQSSR